MGGLGEKAKTLIHRIDTLDYTVPVVTEGDQSQLTSMWMYRPENRHEKQDLNSVGYTTLGPVPQDRIWLVISAVVRNDKRAAWGAFTMAGTASSGIAGLYGQSFAALGANQYVEALQGSFRPIFMFTGDSMTLIDKAFQALDADTYRMTYYEVRP